MGVRAFILLVAVALLAVPAAASAAMNWRPPQTVDLVRGVPKPDVALADDGRAALLYSSADFGDKPRLHLEVRRAGTPEPFISGAAAAAGSTDGQVAMSRAGVTAVAALDAGRLFVTMYPADPASRYQGKVVEIDSPGVADTPQLAVDDAGRATVVWASPPRVSEYNSVRPRQVYAVTVGPDAVPEPVQALGEPGNCDATLDVNLRGDAAVAVSCQDRDDSVFVRPPGGSFGAAERPFAKPGQIQVALDGAGAVHVVLTHWVEVPSPERFPVYGQQYEYAVRPAGGSFGPPMEVGPPDGVNVGPLDLEVQETGRAVMAWLNGGQLQYAVRSTSGGAFGGVTTVGGTSAAAVLDVVASPHGPVLLTWRERPTFFKERVVAALLGSDGALSGFFRGVASKVEYVGAFQSFAINDSGQVAGTWEQRCSDAGGYAVMAVQRDVGGTPKEPPCQDRRAPRAIAAPRRARLVGRTLRVRLACDEACRVTANARVTRPGQSNPLATARTGRERRLPARRGVRFSFRLSSADARRVGAALGGRRKVSLRLAVSVRDLYGNGARRRLVAPVGR